MIQAAPNGLGIPLASAPRRKEAKNICSARIVPMWVSSDSTDDYRVYKGLGNMNPPRLARGWHK